MFIIGLAFLVFLVKQTNGLEGVIMSLREDITALNDSVNALEDRVAALPDAGALQAALDAERAAAIELAAAEDAEDVEQNNAVASAQAETNALIAEIADAKAGLADLKSDIDAIAAEDVEAEEPVEEPVAETPAEETPAEPAVDPVLSGEVETEYTGEPSTATEES